MKINPECPSCHLVNIIFDFHKLPMPCVHCGNSLKIEDTNKVKIEKEIKYES